ncbi:MAG: hypothetical protein JWP65_997 [Ramlibacter sp.]|jgi:tetratricopeptide (TPR) repeat protein|uniref:hypothetical protein n=1 Tax=Ramlibacter sp. TaxID=1917967 RepID=UPI00261E516B|nr:hypothetical protein [Ramlibacter sp.]MDB5750576.1 hypothetical protein [Ramlibacter sp.]
MAPWTACPHAADYQLDAAAVTAGWARLHAGDAEPLPPQPEVLAAWVLFHNGRLQEARDAGMQAGPAGWTVANKATCIHATYVEKKEKARLELLLEAAERACRQVQADAGNANAWYLHALALGRYSQGISVAKALAQGLGGKVKGALERAIALQPRHADAHVALAAFHAEVIDKLGSLIGRMTYGVKTETGLALFHEALRIHPASPIGLVQYANGLVMLEGEEHTPEATRIYRQAAALEPLDAIERLHVELARAELLDRATTRG